MLVGNMVQASKEIGFLRDYLSGVLGLRQFPVGSHARLQVLDLPWPGEGLLGVEMFRNMMKSIGLRAEEVEVLECLESELPLVVDRIRPELPLLSFSEELSAALRELSSRRSEMGEPWDLDLVTAKGPRELKLAPEFKRQTWEILKEMQSKLKPV